MTQSVTTSIERASAYAAFASLLLSPPQNGEDERAFFNRLIVPCSSAYVPLSEQCIRTATCIEGYWTFGAVDGTHRRHVLRCYRHAGFDHRRLCGFEPIVGSLRPDALAAECAFMAFLLAGTAKASDAEAAGGRIDYANAFLREHLNAWVADAARACASVHPDDHVARIVTACASFASSDADLVASTTATTIPQALTFSLPK